jgi:hypothetical protein
MKLGDELLPGSEISMKNTIFPINKVLFLVCHGAKMYPIGSFGEL